MQKQLFQIYNKYIKNRQENLKNEKKLILRHSSTNFAKGIWYSWYSEKNRLQGGEKMRLKLYFELENEKMPIQYRKCILSFIKKSLSEYSEEYYKRLYDGNKPIVKPYTFSAFFLIF